MARKPKDDEYEARPQTFSLAEGDVTVTLPDCPLGVASVDELNGHLTLFVARLKTEATEAAAAESAAE